MNKDRTKIIDKAKKLKELADRGIGGEKENAKRMYGEYKKKHNISEDEINGHQYSEDFIKEFANMTDAQILEVIGKSLIVLGVGLLFSLLSPSEKSNSDNAKRANQIGKMISQIGKNNNNKKTEENVDDEVKGVINILDNIFEKEKQQQQQNKKS